MYKGRTLKIFVMGDSPSSFKSVELSNWTGQSFIGERRHISDVKNREELKQPGIYFLLSDNPENDFTDIYIGETDDFSTRIKNHYRKLDWWNKFVVFISKDKNLTKAHVKYLERKLYLLAKKSIGTLNLKSNNEPGGSKLPESDIADMEIFLDNMIFTLGALGLGYFASEKGITDKRKMKTLNDILIEYEGTIPIKKNNLRLKSVLHSIGGRYILKKGSYLRSEAQPSFKKHSYYELWNQIINSKDVINTKIDGVLVLNNDIEFKSPSAAGAIVRGRATNGRTMWKRKSDSKTLDWVESR